MAAGYVLTQWGSLEDAGATQQALAALPEDRFVRPAGQRSDLLARDLFETDRGHVVAQFFRRQGVMDVVAGGRLHRDQPALRARAKAVRVAGNADRSTSWIE